MGFAMAGGDKEGWKTGKKQTRTHDVPQCYSHYTSHYSMPYCILLYYSCVRTDARFFIFNKIAEQSQTVAIQYKS